MTSRLQRRINRAAVIDAAAERQRRIESGDLRYAQPSPLRQSVAEEARAAVAASGAQTAIDASRRLRGTRTRVSTGQVVPATLPIRVISRYANIGNDGENVRPICAWPNKRDFPLSMWESPDAAQRKELRDKIRAGEMTSENVAGGTQLSFPVRNGIAMAPRFEELEDEETAVIVLTSGGFEHAMLLFLNGGNIWTCGYGFYGDASEADATWKDNFVKLLQKIPGIKDKDADFREAFAHKFETLQGALYTADYLLPSYTQAANIVWVGFMNSGIKERLRQYLDTVTVVQVKTTGTCNRSRCTGVTATNHLTLYVGGSYYQEAAAWMRRDLTGRVKWNCLEWVKHILGENLQCGLLGRPSKCNSVSQQQWDQLVAAEFPHRNSQVVREVQGALLKTDIASVVGSAGRYATSNPRLTSACVGAACGLAATASPVSIPVITPMAATLGTTGCVGAGCLAASAAHEGTRRIVNKKMSEAPVQQTMTRGGRKTRRKRKKRRTRNKHKRRKNKGHRTRHRRKKHRKKRRTRRR